MKCLNNYIKFFFIIILSADTATAQICTKPFHIVILGSSTAAGDGATSYEHAWVDKFEDYLKNIDTNYVVNNLAVSGTTTYAAQPDAYDPPPGRPLPLIGHNITAALKLHPDAIIINYPSNDVVQGFSLKEQKNNFTRITNKASDANVLVWVATPQPRNNLNKKQVERQDSLFAWIKNYYQEKSINFWVGLASQKDSILFKYDSGDGIHFNNRGHEILYQRVIAEHIPDSLCLKNNNIQLAFKTKNE
ncbi:MAG: SGNH/GDSL hydrolase family protein [Chitinophagaceae bacterium]